MNTRKNASGRYLQMSDEQYARYLAAFDRAVERETEKQRERAHDRKAHRGFYSRCTICHPER